MIQSLPRLPIEFPRGRILNLSRLHRVGCSTLQAGDSLIKIAPTSSVLQASAIEPQRCVKSPTWRPYRDRLTAARAWEKSENLFMNATGANTSSCARRVSFGTSLKRVGSTLRPKTYDARSYLGKLRHVIWSWPIRGRCVMTSKKPKFGSMLLWFDSLRYLCHSLVRNAGEPF